MVGLPSDLPVPLGERRWPVVRVLSGLAQTRLPFSGSSKPNQAFNVHANEESRPVGLPSKKLIQGV